MQFNPNNNAELLALLQNPEIYQINSCPAHSDHSYYPSLAAARSSSEMPWRLCLGGDWSFHYAENLNSRPIGFEAEDYDISGFDTIQIGRAHV